MYSQMIKDKLKNISRSRNVNFNILLRAYMYERFIERLSLSPYKDNFVLKGGYYLSILFGIDSRTTMDIDACLKNSSLTKSNLYKIISEIVSIEIDDGAVIVVSSIEEIIGKSKYGGYRVNLTVKIDNVKESFHFDIATGDTMTPGSIKFEYKGMIDNKTYNVLAYSIETVLAEKLETILYLGAASTRMKDYYDIYLIASLRWEEIDIKYLREAIANTFKNRSFNGDVNEIYSIIKNSDILEESWNRYTRVMDYAEGISYDDVMIALEKIIEVSLPVTL